MGSNIIFLGGCLADWVIPQQLLRNITANDEPLPLPGDPRLLVIKGGEPIRMRIYVLRGNIATNLGLLAKPIDRVIAALTAHGDKPERVSSQPGAAGEASEAFTTYSIDGKMVSREKFEVEALIRSDPRVK